MSLSSKQQQFSRCLSQLLNFLNSQGYLYRLKHLMRCPECKVGHPKSTHKSSLAADIIFSDVTGHDMHRKSDYQAAANFWKRLHPDARWGGDFDLNADGEDGDDPYHFSFEHENIK